MRVPRHMILRLALAAAVVIVLSPRPGMADIRLDASVAPTFQSVTLDLDAEKTEYSGSVHIELDVKRATSTFQFHAEEMSLDKVVLSDKSGPIAVEIEDGEEGMRTVTCERELKPGALTLDIEFSKEYNTKAVGLYRMTTDGNGYLFSQFQAVDARKAFPCWDEPIHKIPYQLTITVPMVQVAVTNTPVEKEIIGASTRTYQFKKTPPMPSYLLAIAAGRLESVAIPGLSVPGRIYTVKGQKSRTRLAAKVTPPILAALEDYFGREYPYEKLDLIAVPEFWPGAMENAGAVTYRDNLLLLETSNASVSQKRLLARVTAHELAHMWFGDLVTMSWWDDLWLNESFADWMGDKITDQLFPEYDLHVSELQDVQGLMQRDARPSTTPVRKPVETTAAISEDLSLAYGKGKTVLRMVEEYIGSEAFQMGVRNYINKHAWGNTVASDLFAALSDAADDDLTPILSSFLDQSGFPVIGVDLESGGVVTVSQKRFLNHGVEAENQLWSVPVRLKYSDGENVMVRTMLLDKESERMELGTNVEWMMPDAGSFGYYRWTAPRDMMFKMAENPAETLDKRERATFLANAKALLIAGEMQGDEYLTILGSFANFPEPEIVTAVLDDLGTIRFAFVSEDLEDEFAHYVREMLRPSMDKVGLEAEEGEAETVSILRPRLIQWMARYGRDQSIREHCKKLAAAFMQDPSSVDGSMAAMALRVAAIDGTIDDFNEYAKRFDNAESPADRGRYLRAMGSFSDEKLQEKALGYVAGGKVRPNEVFGVIGNINSTTKGRNLTWRWLSENYDAIAAQIPKQFHMYMPFFVSGCSEERLAAATAFFSDPARTVDGMDKNLTKVSEQVADCVNLREREGAVVADYLTKLAAAR